MPTSIVIQEDQSDSAFALDDRIFLGEGLCETLRVVKSRPCYPKPHWQRLQSTAFFLGLSFDVSLATWLEKLIDCIRRKKLQEGGIKVILSGGSAPRGLLAYGEQTKLIFTAFEYSKNQQPLTLVSAPWRRDAKNCIYQLKSINYLEAIIARRQIEAASISGEKLATPEKIPDVLFFNLADHATETSVANFFIIKDNQLFTPSLHCGVLPGIIRERILVICKQQGIACFEIELPRAKIMQADAAFTCNALQGITPVCSFESQTFNASHPVLLVLQKLLLQEEPSL